MTVGDRIRKQRELSGISQTELAEKIAVKKQTLYKYEMNLITNIPNDVIEKIAKILNVSESYLMGWDKKDRLSNDNIELDYMLLTDDNLRGLLFEYQRLDPDHKKMLKKYLDFLTDDMNKKNWEWLYCHSFINFGNSM